MIDAVSKWILGLVSTALIAAVCQSLVPKGKSRKTVSIVCGAAIMAALLSIGTDIDYEDLAVNLAKYRTEAENTVSEALTETTVQTRYIIEEKLEAYILDKAAQFEVNISAVEVTAKWSEEGVWYPQSVSLTGAANDAQKEKLSKLIISELGVPEEKQIWSTDDAV